MIENIIVMVVTLLFLTSAYIIGIRKNKKKLTGILLIFFFIFMMLYLGVNYFPSISYGTQFEDFHVIVDLQTPIEGSLSISKDEQFLSCQEDIYRYSYNQIFIGILGLQYKSSSNWEETSTNGKTVNKIQFYALEPERFQFRTASFASSPKDVGVSALYETWHVRVIFPEKYEVDKDSCEGYACNTISFSTENGRDVMEFESNGFAGLKVLYHYVD